MRRAIALACLSACGLFPDVGPLASGDASTDATTDAALDGGNGGDASTDATTDALVTDGGDGSVVPKSPCTAKHDFCDDFDDGSLGATWSSSDNTGGGTLSQSTTAVTPPYAFESKVPAFNSGTAVLTKTFSTSAQHIHFECDLLIVGAQDAGSMEIDPVDVRLSPAPTGFASADFNLERVQPGPGLVEQYSRVSGADAGTYHDDDISEDFHVWRHLVIDVDFTKASVTTIVDGATIDVLSMTPPFTSAPVILTIGISYSAGLKSTWSVLMDNVFVDLQ